MEKYEITFLTRSEEDQAGIADLIVQLGGQIFDQSNLGLKTLAYPIGRDKTAAYFTYQFELEPSKVIDLNQKLRRTSQVIRYLIIAGGIRQPLPVPPKSTLGDVEIPASLAQGMAELAKSEPVVPVTEISLEAAIAKPETIEEPKKKAAPKKEVAADELTAEERQQKLEEKLKSILGK